jgi:hypothetical protein
LRNILLTCGHCCAATLAPRSASATAPPLARRGAACAGAGNPGCRVRPKWPGCRLATVAGWSSGSCRK